MCCSSLLPHLETLNVGACFIRGLFTHVDTWQTFRSFKAYVDLFKVSAVCTTDLRSVGTSQGVESNRGVVPMALELVGTKGDVEIQFILDLKFI